LVIKTKQEATRKTVPRIKLTDVPKTDSMQMPETKQEGTTATENKSTENAVAVKEEDIDKKIEELLGEN